MIADELDMSKEAVRDILIHNAGICMRNLAANLVHTNLTKEQKDRHLTLCSDFAGQLQGDVPPLVIKRSIISMIPKLNASP
jgi:hypothetical protein